MENFAPTQYSYRQIVEEGKKMPTILVEKAEQEQIVRIDTTNGNAIITVLAEDTTYQSTYSIYFDYQKSSYSYLEGIYQDGILIEHMFVGTNLKVVGFVDDDSETVLELGEDDYKELAYTYLNYKNGGYKHCKCCGKLFKMNKNAPGRLYCKDCGQKEEIDRFKVLKCVDCGEDFVVDTRNMNKCRCDSCQHEVDKEKTRQRVQKYRERQ
jgi:hypothetical protein